jgi:hypothetical protein
MNQTLSQTFQGIALYTLSTYQPPHFSPGDVGNMSLKNTGITYESTWHYNPEDKNLTLCAIMLHTTEVLGGQKMHST